MGNQNPYIEEHTTQWPKEKVQKDKQRSTKHTHKTKYRVTRTPLKTGGELRRSGRVDSSASSSDTRRVNLVTNPVISYERGTTCFTLKNVMIVKVVTYFDVVEYTWCYVTEISWKSRKNIRRRRMVRLKKTEHKRNNINKHTKGLITHTQLSVF